MTLKPTPFYKASTSGRVGTSGTGDYSIGFIQLLICIAMFFSVSVALICIISDKSKIIKDLSHSNTLLKEEIVSLNDKNKYLGGNLIIIDNRLNDALHASSVGKIKNKVLGKEILDISSKRVRVTGYHPASGGINSDSNPSMTSTMTPHKAGYTCAISTKLVEAGWLGKEIYIEGYGMVLANDRLASGIKGYQIDLCKGSYKEAMEVGKKSDVLATLVNRKIINQKLENN